MSTQEQPACTYCGTTLSRGMMHYCRQARSLWSGWDMDRPGAYVGLAPPAATLVAVPVAVPVATHPTPALHDAPYTPPRDP